MITRIFKIKKELWGIITAVFLMWIGAVTFLLYQYGVRIPFGLIDSFISTLFIIGGWLLLENVFRFYTPKKSNYWLVVFLPLVLSFVATFIINYVLQLIIQDIGYLNFLQQALVARGGMIFILLMAFSIITVIYGRLEDQLKSKEREEVALNMSRETELYHLRSQLQPHFLFNSLNSINALMVSQPEKAREMVFQLSDFLRGTIRKGAEQLVEFAEELDTLKLYLDIEKVRFGHRLQVQIEAENSTERLQLPALLLQPLVENAVKFGLYGMVGDVSITIKAIAKGSYLHVVIRNPYDPTDTPPPGSGFGLSAVKRRLYLLFGRHDLLDTSMDNNIFTVTINIPQLK